MYVLVRSLLEFLSNVVLDTVRDAVNDIRYDGVNSKAFASSSDLARAVQASVREEHDCEHGHWTGQNTHFGHVRLGFHFG